MAVFHFRLQPVYDLRLQQEKEQKDVFARQMRLLNDLFYEGETLKKTYSEWSARYWRAAHDGISPIEAMRFSNYLEELRRCMEQNTAKTAQQEQEVEKARELLSQRIKDRRVVEILREKRLSEFRAEERKKQEREVEELVASRLM